LDKNYFSDNFGGKYFGNNSAKVIDLLEKILEEK